MNISQVKNSVAQLFWCKKPQQQPNNTNKQKYTKESQLQPKRIHLCIGTNIHGAFFIDFVPL